MSSFEEYFRIAGLTIKVESPFRFRTYNAENFICGPADPDYVFRFEKTDDIQRILDQAEIDDNCRWADVFRRPDGTYFRGFLWKEHFYTEITELHDREGICYYVDEGVIMSRFVEGFEMLNYLCIEEILLRFQGLVLHSSHLNYKGRGLLFSAPSQTGKSTQAELWRQYAGAEVLNGDRTVLRKIDGCWNSFGCPMCGTSNIHKEGNEILQTIVMLSQGKTNVCTPLHPGMAFRLLYPQITVPSWNDALVDLVFDLLNDLISNVPVYGYSCNMDPDAVTTLMNAIGWGEQTEIR